MATDVTDATFETAVLTASMERPVVVDLWAPWCGPCRTLGPIIEKVVDEQMGAVALVKVNIDENPQIAQAFRVQSIPAVFAISGGSVVDSFIGALPETEVRAFIERLGSAPSEADLLVEAGDEASLRRALESEPDHEQALVALAGILVARGESEEALALLARAPESTESRHLVALARLGIADPGAAADDLEPRLAELLERVRDDDAARLEFLELLEALDPEDDRRGIWRRRLGSRLF
jgi:putative thioredoxin